MQHKSIDSDDGTGNSFALSADYAGICIASLNSGMCKIAGVGEGMSGGGFVSTNDMHLLAILKRESEKGVVSIINSFTMEDQDSEVFEDKSRVDSRMDQLYSTQLC
ncbi:MAG: hypothetical protein U0176_24435 [Bacteroidia bacterium]